MIACPDRLPCGHASRAEIGAQQHRCEASKTCAVKDPRADARKETSYAVLRGSNRGIWAEAATFSGSQGLKIAKTYTGDMRARDVRVEPLVGSIVLLVLATYFSLTQINGLALLILIGLTAAFALQILYSQIRITAAIDRDHEVCADSVKRAPRAFLWSIFLLVLSVAVVLASLWFVASRLHFQALVSLGAGVAFILVAILGLRAATELKRSRLQTS